MTSVTKVSAIKVSKGRKATPAMRTLQLIVGFLILLMVLAPVYWMLITALRSNADLFSVPPKLLPVDLDPGVAGNTVVQTPILSWLANSAILSISTTVLAILFGVPAGYALSRFTGRGTRTFGSAVLITQMLPPLLLLVPLFIIFQRVDLTDSLLGLIIADTATVLPLTIWMSKAMMDSVPHELDEAAMIDGCSRFRALVYVVFPVSRAGITSVAIYAFIVTWDEFLFAKTLLTSADKWPASVGIYTFQGQYTVPINQVMFAAILFTIPPLLLFYFAKRGLVAGMTAGAVKG